MAETPLRIAMIGLGTVGSGVARILHQHRELLQQRAGRPLELRRVVVRDLKKTRDVDLPGSLVTDSPTGVLDDPEIDVVLELMGGTTTARDVVLQALENGKDVVTANKALLCQAGDELFGRAVKLGRTIAFEAAVAGGIPIIAAVSQSMSANRIQSIQAILNGTSNYILSQMLLAGQSYSDALGQAQELGYAEADPTLDIDGTDAAQKLTLLVRLAFGISVPVSDFHVSGIDRIEPIDISSAGELGYTIKLIAQARLGEAGLALSVRPTLVRKDRPLAQTHGSLNAVALDGDSVGPLWMSGRGAGSLPTASAVVADLVDMAVGRAQLTFPRLGLGTPGQQLPIASRDEFVSRFYLRLTVEDRPHVMADVTDILGRRGISLASVIQHEAPEVSGDAASPHVPLIIMTHRTTAGAISAAERELDDLKTVRGNRVCLAVAD